MAGIYLHIPFCKQACYYCDFHFSTNFEKREEIIEAIAKELYLQQSYLEGEKISTIYFGGGTPSLLRLEELQIIFKAIAENFTITSNPEITLEANPDDLSLEHLKALKQLGINRLSIGIQSFDDDVLRFLNRAHDSAAALRCVAQARQTGFDNISVDLIYAIPNQDLDTWKKNVLSALALHPEHISAYSLTIEEKTVFGKWYNKGKLAPVEDDLAATQLETLTTMLESNGFEQYEISNFAQPGFYAKHNSSYWRQQKYLGVGPSAHSYNRISRQFNISNNHLYLKALTDNKIPFTMEKLTREDNINDYLLTTLRTAWGTDVEKLKEEFAYDLLHHHRTYIHTLIDNGLATLLNSNLKLTKRGRLVADKISTDLFIIK